MMYVRLHPDGAPAGQARIHPPKARSARASSGLGDLGVGCVKTLAPVPPEISDLLSVATQHV